LFQFRSKNLQQKIPEMEVQQYKIKKKKKVTFNFQHHVLENDGYQRAI